jgi:hypothetical protein
MIFPLVECGGVWLVWWMNDRKTFGGSKPSKRFPPCWDLKYSAFQKPAKNFSSLFIFANSQEAPKAAATEK